MKSATNASVMRESNRKLILNLIRLNPISRVELSQQTGLTRASITQIVDELIQAKLVMETDTLEHKGSGRRRIQLAIRSDSYFVFSVNLRRRYYEIGTINLDGEVLLEQRIPLERGYNPVAILNSIAKTILEQQQKLNIDEDKVLGIGISTPGPVDHISGTVLNPPNFMQWHKVKICSKITKLTGYKTLLEKDTNARVLEEKYFGVGKNVSNFLLLQIDDGVGAGVMVQDKLYRGVHGMATEVGHMSISYDGPLCSCGNRGCLENYASIPALLKGSPFDSWMEVTEACASKTPDLAIDIINRAATYLSTALVNTINLYDLEQIILTGDIAHGRSPLLEKLNAKILGSVLGAAAIKQIVINSAARSSVRTAAMAVLHDMFQDRT